MKTTMLIFVFLLGITDLFAQTLIVVVSVVPGVSINCGNALVTNTRIPLLIREEAVVEVVVEKQVPIQEKERFYRILI